MRFRDLSENGKLVATGTDRVRFLNGLFSNDIAKLEPGTGCHAAMLTVKGKLLGDAIVLCDASSFQLDLAPTLTEKLQGTMEHHIIVDDVVIEDRSAALDEVFVFGEGTAEALAGIVGAIPELPLYGHVERRGTRIVRVRDLGFDGFRLIGGARALCGELHGEGAISWMSDEEAEVLRIEAGVPRYGMDMGEDHLPIESRLDDAISHTKGCYMGQEVIARTTVRGHINRKLVGLRIGGSAPAERGARLSAEGRDEAGTITSSVLSPRHGPIALGYVHRKVWDPGTALVVHESTGPRAATVVELPFS